VDGPASPSISSILFRFTRDSAVPVVLAGMYAYWAWVTDPQQQTAPSAVKNFSVAYFFLMWFVGQFLRVSKQLRDESMLRDISLNVNSIRDSLKQAAPADTQRETPDERIQKLPDATIRNLLQEARTAMDNDLRLSAVLAGAVAFERAIREFALRHELSAERTASVPRLLQKMVGILGPGTVGDLLGLWRTRNEIIHLTEEQLDRLPSAPNVLESFFWAIELLSHR
jgi:hypothetical protein